MSDTALLSTALAGRYRVERELGAGGMATVYLAHDLRHHRRVALKVLRPELAAVIGAERFLQEIEVTANLQHPHILPLHDSGQVDGTAFYVMPYVEGESLRDRLRREKQLPVAEAIRIAREVASALDYAHRHGVIHRDIKPENILLHDAQALVADFGIALAASSGGGARMTETGMSLGTPQYMSPEQAMGDRELSARSDVYALGCVLYEMLIGEPPFTGPTAQAIVARLMTEDPRALTIQRQSIPPHVEAAVRVALSKLPADRFPTAAAFSQALASPDFATPLAATGARPSTTRMPASRGWLLAAVALNVVLGVAALWLWLGPKPGAGVSRHRVVLWSRALPPPLEPGVPYVATQAAIAPDGSSIIYSDSSGGRRLLMRKRRDAGEAVPIAGTEGAVSPFFSPDGRWIGYITLDARVRKVPVEGGSSITLAEDAIGDYKVGTWLDDGTILYSNTLENLVRISADGGSPLPLRLKDRLGGSAAVAVSHVWPLPGSRGFLFAACSGNCAIESNLYIFDFRTDTLRLLVPRAAGGWYAPTGHVLYTAREGGLFAAPFDVGRLTITRGAIPVLDDVEPTRFTLSASGAALYSIDVASRTPAELVWVTRDGRVAPVDSSWRGRFEYPSLSPDGSALAVSVRERTTDLWIRRADGRRQKVIAEGAANWRASWMPDGQSLAFVSVRNPAKDPNDVGVYVARADGAANTERLVRHTYGVWEAEVSRDGQWLVIRSDEPGYSNLRARRLGSDTALIPLVVDRGNSLQVALSPNGRWLAYTSNESGQQYDVYVASFPTMASKRLVSRGGGTEPRWSRDGRELFFKGDGSMMVVDVTPGESFNPGNPRPLFSLAGYRSARNRQQYDVAPDGRFVMIREAGEEVPGVVYVENWLAELEAKLRQ